MDTAEYYREWARLEAAGQSPTYHALAIAVSEDAEVLEFLDALPEDKRQPNLLFGAMRWHGAPVAPPELALGWLRGHYAGVRATMLSRRTQTNEVARCAVLLPALALLPQPLAILEVGASAGLCLHYEQWRYRYLRDGAPAADIGPDDALTLECAIDGPVPVPRSVPDIAWRRGLDLNPLDPTAPGERRWLECLVWPEHIDRAARLRAALDVASATPATVVRGDLIADLDGALDAAPAGATLVVVHSATLAYVDAVARERFLRTLKERGAHRVGMEGPRVLPQLRLPTGMEVDGDMVLSLDDRALGLAQPHGRHLRWFAST